MPNDLNNLLDRVERVDRSLAAELRTQINTLARRREFGLNFEKHKPETVELYGRTVRVGDKVRLITPRGQNGPPEDARTWRVQTITKTKTKTGHQAHLREIDGDTERDAELDEIVVIADFRDPIYPGLRSTGAVRRGGDKPHHVVINAENFHALEAMLFTHQGTVSAAFLDPPYNSGARDWKYSNDYVDAEDGYRHSKWLAFMERRLKLARKLLNPTNSVLIISIDEREYLRLGLLLEQTFPEARIQMISVAINPAAIARGSEFRRADEYYFFVMLGDSAPLPVPLASDWITTKGRTHRGEIRWDLLRRSAASSARSDRPGMFFPIFLNPDTRTIHSVGDAIDLDTDRTAVAPPDGTIAVWPIRRNGTEGRWRLGPSSTREALTNGFVKVGAVKGENTPIYYLTVGEQRKIQDGIYTVTGRDTDGSVITSTLDSDERRVIPSTQWRVASHDSTQYGSRMLMRFIPDRRFPFPKSLYAVEDALRFFLADKPDAVVVDFFAGSGTTAHAVMRLNHQDGGHRRSIMVTNNEVSATEETSLRRKGHRPGDPEWEALGICDYITKPRIEAAITGLTPSGEPIRGEYQFTDPFPMADGLEENVEFFTLTYEDPRVVGADMAFEAIAPLLWMRAGARGEPITSTSDTFALADAYAVLFAIDAAGDFAAAVDQAGELEVAFIVTDDERQFQRVAALLPGRVETVRLYESYLRTFEINTGKE
jgi:adenine-specific DNA-methyltransferase